MTEFWTAVVAGVFVSSCLLVVFLGEGAGLTGRSTVKCLGPKASSAAVVILYRLLLVDLMVRPFTRNYVEA